MYACGYGYPAYGYASYGYPMMYGGGYSSHRTRRLERRTGLDLNGNGWVGI